MQVRIPIMPSLMLLVTSLAITALAAACAGSDATPRPTAVVAQSEGPPQLWTRQFGTRGEDGVIDVAVDGVGRIYVAGEVTRAQPGQTGQGGGDSFVRAYSSEGEELWTRQFGTVLSDRAVGLALDGSGRIYVVGGTLAGPPLYEAYLLAYDSEGQELWTRQVGTNSGDVAADVAVDDAGHVYVVSSNVEELRSGGAGTEEAFVRAYDNEAQELWNRRFGSGDAGFASGVAVFGTDRVYAVGMIASALPGQTSQGGKDAYLRAYDSSGRELWTRQFGTNGLDRVSSVVVGDVSREYVAGFAEGPLPGEMGEGREDAYVRAYDSEGLLLWTHQFGTSGFDSAEGIAVDMAGRVYVVGIVAEALPGQTSQGRSDAFLRVYDASDATE